MFLAVRGGRLSQILISFLLGWFPVLWLYLSQYRCFPSDCSVPDRGKLWFGRGIKKNGDELNGKANIAKERVYT